MEKKIRSMDGKKVAGDLEPFLLKTGETGLVNRKNLLLFLDQYRNTLGETLVSKKSKT
ncbi:MAG: hypothetical protein PHF84_06520 [bacterium]|nr:hypothetical protein [bacterium]